MKLVVSLLLVFLLVSFNQLNAQFSNEYDDLIKNENIIEQNVFSYYGSILDYDKSKMKLMSTIKINRIQKTISYTSMRDENKEYKTLSSYDKSWNLIEHSSFSDEINTSLHKIKYSSDGKLLQSKRYDKPKNDTLNLNNPTVLTNCFYGKDGNMSMYITKEKRIRSNNTIQTDYTKHVFTYDKNDLIRISEVYTSYGDSTKYKLKSTHYGHYNKDNKRIQEFTISDYNNLTFSKKKYYSKNGELIKLEKYESNELNSVTEYKYEDGLLIEEIHPSSSYYPNVEIRKYEYKFKE